MTFFDFLNIFGWDESLTFPMFVQAMLKEPISWVLLLWMARWIYNILIDIGNERIR